MVLIASESRRAFGSGAPLTNAQIHAFHIGFAVVAAVAAVLFVAIYPPELDDSGLYCYARASEPAIFGMFVALFLVPMFGGVVRADTVLLC